MKYLGDYYGKLHHFYKISKQPKPQPTEQHIYEALVRKNYDFITKSFLKCENELAKSKFDLNFSGTTCVICITLGIKLIVANAGDSRAIMIIDKTLKVKAHVS